MKQIRVSFDGGAMTDFLMLDKPTFDALASLADANPRSQFIWFNYDTVSAWGMASNRVMKATQTSETSTSWCRLPLADAKKAKALAKDLILLRQHGLDVVDMVVVRFHTTKGMIQDNAPVVISDKPDPELPGKGVSKVEFFRFSLPPQGVAEYRVEHAEPVFVENTGGTVSRVTLPVEHIEPVSKMSKALGKPPKAKKNEVQIPYPGLVLTPGRGDSPCVWRGTGLDGTSWAYALLSKEDK